MPDQADPGLQRIALVFGDKAAAAHVCEAVHGQCDIAYATSAADFDAATMAKANVSAALVNLDDGDWLDAVEASLDAAGVAVIYNDPAISHGLEGWPRARWLRHLLAKLRGSSDVDPPRPPQAGPPAGETSAVSAPETPAGPARNEAAAVERPLSPQEIETMTADFVAVSGTTFVQVGEVAPQPERVIIDGPAAADAPANPGAFGSADGPAEVAMAAQATQRRSGEAVAGDGAPATNAMPAEPAGDGARGSDDNLDVDTETLSAMIDARIADADSRTPPDSPEVWRVVEGGAVSTVHLDPVAEPDHEVAPDETAEPQWVASAVREDSDVLASLPSLDDWQLVDGDAATAPAPAATREAEETAPALSGSLAGLELVPMEIMSGIDIHTDPIERWLDDSQTGKSRARAESAEGTGSNRGKP